LHWSEQLRVAPTSITLDDLAQQCNPTIQGWWNYYGAFYRPVSCICVWPTAQACYQGIAMHPEKSKIVYCKDNNRTGAYPNVQFTFLGFTFRPRMVLSKHNRRFTSFLPAVSNVVDDDLYALVALETLISEAGHSVMNSKDALEQAQRRQPDVVVSDMMMPVMDGPPSSAR
jgi:Response regulator receiver domain/Group II intron, maturase-specific domain